MNVSRIKSLKAIVTTSMAEEKTFKAFNAKQAQAYLARGAYHDRLYDLILRAHDSMGGAFGKFVDVGCGPGNSTRELAKHFDRTWGSDPSEGMIETARQLSEDVESETKSGGKIVWEVGRAEDVGAGGREGEVDMITAAMAVRESLLASCFSPVNGSEREFVNFPQFGWSRRIGSI